MALSAINYNMLTLKGQFGGVMIEGIDSPVELPSL
jgi:hypothetical protein